MYEISDEDLELFINNEAVINIENITDPITFKDNFPIINGLTIDERFNKLFTKMGEDYNNGFLSFYENYRKSFPLMIIKNDYMTAYQRQAINDNLKGMKVIYPKLAEFDI